MTGPAGGGAGGWPLVWARARVADTVIAAVATLLGAAALLPLFADASWLVPAAAMVVAVAVTGAVTRALAMPIPLVPVSQGLVLLIVVTAMFAANAAVLRVVPTPDAWEALGAQLGRGMADAAQLTAPVPALTGMVLLAVGGVGLAALAVDSLFVSIRTPLLAGLPLLGMYLVGALVPLGGHPWWAFALPATGWLLILAADQRTRLRERAGVDPSTRIRGLSAPARRIGLVAVAIAAAVGVLLPAAGPSWRSGEGDGPGPGVGAGPVLLDPLVSMRRSLVQRDDSQVLRYQTDAPAPSYLRIAVLEKFDGDSWLPREGLVTGRDVGVALPGPVPEGTSSADRSGPSRTYDIEVTSLANAHLPLPYPVAAIEDDGGLDDAWQLDPATGMASSDAVAATGVAYRAIAQDAVIRPGQLRDAQPATGEFWPLLALPNTLAPEIGDLAAEVTADAGTPYDRAVALQRWFTNDGGFTYSTDVRSGADADYMAEFLQDRVGYCEQFAGAMAVMARVLGIPSRVVVGFTQGTRIDGGSWQVTSGDAHAWPELWFDKVGWVRFEPTPRADATVQAPDYAPTRPVAADTTDERQEALLDLGDGSGDPQVEQSDGPSGAVMAVLAVAGLALAVVLVMALAPMVRRAWRRRRRLADDARIAEGAWAEVADLAVDLDQPWSATSTPRQAGERLARGMPEAAASALRRLRQEYEASRYGRPGSVVATRERAEAVRADLRRVTVELRGRVRWRTRLGAYCWPSSERRRQRSSMRSMKPGPDGLADGFSAGPAAGSPPAVSAGAALKAE